MSLVSVEFDPSTMLSMFDHPSWTGVNLEEFHLFPKLAVELRLMIWRACLPGPRLLNVPSSFVEHQPVPDYMPIPLPLSICKESREETLKYYHHIEYWINTTSLWMSYINYKTDTLYLLDFLHFRVESLGVPSGNDKIQSLLINMSEERLYRKDSSVFMKLKANYPSLKTLNIQLESHFCIDQWKLDKAGEIPTEGLPSFESFGSALKWIYWDYSEDKISPRVLIEKAKKELEWDVNAKFLVRCGDWGFGMGMAEW